MPGQMLPPDVLTLVTLGDCRASRTLPDGKVATFGRGKPFAMMAYLAALPRGSASRDELVGLLWADVDREAGRHALRQTVWYIRKRLGEDVIDGDANVVRLACAVDVDRTAFITDADQGNCASAVARWSGEFLPNIALAGGGEFERWAEVERSRLRSTFVRCAEEVVREYLSAGRYRDAQLLARRICAADPYDQSARRLLLEADLSAADLLAAKTDADALEQFLRNEEIEAEPATRGAIEAARASRPVGAPEFDTPRRTSRLAAELIGRELEFSRLVARWTFARNGAHSHVHVVGPAGIGKSRLLQDFAARLGAKRSRVAHVRANPGERHLPFTLAADLAEALARLPGAAGLGASSAAALVALNPALSSTYSAVGQDQSVGAEAARRRALALAELARVVADDAPLAILVDDLHWADPDSKQLLAGAIARLDGTHSLVVTTSRPGEEIVLQRDPSEVIELAPLGDTAIADLVEAIGRLPDATWAADFAPALRAATGGAPLLVFETLQLALDDGLLALVDAAWTCEHPERLRAQMRAGSALERRVRELSDHEAMLLRLLAVAGVQLGAREIAIAASLNLDVTHGALLLLERRGLIVHSGDAWRPAHDEIADRALQHASEADLRRAHAQVAAHFAAPERYNARLAVAHYVAAGDHAAVRDLFRAELRSLRRAGDWRETADICREFLGPGAPAHTVTQLCASVPFTMRRRRRIVSVVALIALTAATTLWIAASNRVAPEVNSWLWLSVVDGGRTSFAAVPIDASTFRDDAPLEVSFRRQRPKVLRDTLNARTPIRLADGSLVYAKTLRDSGGIDVFRLTPAGVEQRLTRAPGDDAPADRSPDGTRIVITTQRWSNQQHGDLAILDPQTGTLSAFTSGNENEYAAAWSPDGTRIAFGRNYFTPREPELCVRPVDGIGEHCVTYPNAFAISPLGWRGPGEVLAHAQVGATAVLLRLNTRTWETSPVLTGGTAYRVSRDGEVFAVRDFNSAGSEGGWAVGPVAEPQKLRRIVTDTLSSRSVDITFSDGTRAASYLDTLRVLVPAGGIPVDAPQRLLVRGSGPKGRLQDVRALRWRSLDSGVARVSVDGMVSPIREGRFRVVASAGGWRSDTATIAVVGPQAAPLLTETWERLDTTRWAPFGYPRPYVSRYGGGGALEINGDSTFDSGVHSKEFFQPTAGLAIRAKIGVELTELQWQASLAQVVAVDPVTLRAWDHSTGALATGGLGLSCGAGIPFAEGYPGVRSLSLTAPGEQASFPLTAAQQRGAWLQVDIQVFPDGRCGVALDGKPAYLSRAGFDASHPVVILLMGKSVRTHSRVGPVEAWSGVRPGIDWTPLLEGVATGAAVGQRSGAPPRP